ncbi:MAG: alpha/beta fold hydrolase [Verrucomicrobiales bacterium]|nr:alpha/beta fold hydrolase [Verrucomicrobiales bacterium]
MKVLLRVIPVVFLGSSLFAADIESDHSINGTWKGTLQVLGQKLPLIFEIEENKNGSAKGSLISPKQTLQKIPVTQVSLKDRNVKFWVQTVGGSFEGKLSPKSKTIKGEWTQGGNALPLELEFSEEGFAIERPQNPKGKVSYKEELVKFPNKFGPHNLAGTLTFPNDATTRAVPAVILVSGSGPQDRDETLFGHKPFWVIADYLTKQGIAVLRYDDRGVGASGGYFDGATHMDLATDASAAVEYLTSRKEIDPKRIGIIGHSEGGMLGPIVATKREDIAFLVLLAGPGISGAETILTQSKAIGTASGLHPELIQLNQDFLKAVFEEMQKQVPDGERIADLGRKFEAEVKKVEGLDPSMLENLEQTMFQSLKQIESPWFHNFVKYDPGPTLEKVKCPVYALNGEVDLQVLADINLPEIEAHLKAGGNRNYKTEKIMGHNHLFQPSMTGIPAEYGRIETTFSPLVLRKMSTWIESVTN